jgi:TRAP-type transport system periplasmic protein
MRKSLILILSFLFGLAVCGSTQTKAWAKDPIELSLVTFTSLKSTEYTDWKPLFVDKINEKAKGELVIKVRGGQEVIPMPDQPMAVKRGIVDICTGPAGFLKSIVPGADCARLSQMDQKEERRIGAVDYLRGQYEKGGLYYLGRAWPLSHNFFYLFTNKKVMKPEDFKGMKLGSSPSFLGFFKGLGTSPVVVPMADYYTAMERGVIDGYVTSLTVFTAMGLYQKTKYVIDHPFYRNPSPLIVNLAKWKSLPPHLQKIMQDTAIELETTYEPADTPGQVAMRKKTTDAGVEYHKLPPETEKFYFTAAYDAAWEDDAKIYPPEVVAKLKEFFKK